MTTPTFRKTVIGTLPNDVGRSPMNTFFAVGDVDGDGRPDVVCSGRDGTMAWFRNPGVPDRPWPRHVIDPAIVQLECGGVVHDLTGTGTGDVICGGDWRSDELYWWENPGPGAPPDRPWVRRVIAKTGANQFHDELIGDVTGDGTPSLVFWNQKAGALCRVPLPADPRVSPWPGVEVIAAGMSVAGLPEEGLAIADLDGDGRNEIVAGTHWYAWDRATSAWRRHRYADEALAYVTTVLAVADVDGDGELEIVLSEGDACIYGRADVGGRVAWFKRGTDATRPWTEHVVATGLLDPHSLAAADVGRGVVDLVVGEIGLKDAYPAPAAADAFPQRRPRAVRADGDRRRHGDAPRQARRPLRPRPPGHRVPPAARGGAVGRARVRERGRPVGAAGTAGGNAADGRGEVGAAATGGSVSCTT